MGFRMIIESTGGKVKDWMRGKGSGMAPKAGEAIGEHNKKMKEQLDELDEPVKTRETPDEEEEPKKSAKRGFRRLM